MTCFVRQGVVLSAGGFIVEKRVEPTILADNQLSYPVDLGKMVGAA